MEEKKIHQLKVALYIRVSTPGQEKRGYSLGEQQSMMEEYCERLEHDIYDKYIDAGISGELWERPEFQRMLRDVKKKRFDMIIACDVKRFSRDYYNTAKVMKEYLDPNDVNLKLLDSDIDPSTPNGRFMFNIFAANAERDKEEIKEKMMMGKLGRAKSGKPMSFANAPYGYRYNKEKQTYDIHELEAGIVRQMFKDYADGLSLTGLLKKLNQEGHISRNKPWNFNVLASILENPVYMGKNRFRGKLYTGNHTALIDDTLFQLVQNEREKKRVTQEMLFNPRPFRSKYMLSGLLRCGVCGSNCQIETSFRFKDKDKPKKDREHIHKYACNKRYVSPVKRVPGESAHQCSSPFYYKEDLEAEVLRSVQELSLSPNALSLNTEADVPTVQPIEREEKLIGQKIKKLSDLYMNDLITKNEMEEQAKVLNKQLKELEKKITAIEERSLDAEEKEILQNTLVEAADIFQHPYEDQARIVKILIRSITLKGEKIVIEWAF